MQFEKLTFDIPAIMECQRNRYPMLFIDFVSECVPGEYAKGIKTFSINEWFFHGYSTGEPKVWNVIQIEAMSQMFLMTFLTNEELRGKVAMSNRFSNVNFYRKITPGDTLFIEAELDSLRRGIAKGRVKGFVENEIACSMECVILIPDQMVLANTDSKNVPIDVGIANDWKTGRSLNYPGIRACLLNHYPWLFIDRVIDHEPGKFVRAIKNFTFNEHFFPSHFESDPSVPGFIQIETCMQAFLLTFLTKEEYKRKETADRKLDNVVIKRKIRPGETLSIEAILTKSKRGIFEGEVLSFVGEEPAVSFNVTVVLISEFNKFMPAR